MLGTPIFNYCMLRNVGSNSTKRASAFTGMAGIPYREMTADCCSMDSKNGARGDH